MSGTTQSIKQRIGISGAQAREALIAPLFDYNPITRSMLGVCSALAVTTSLDATLVMCLAVIVVLSFSNTAIDNTL